MTNKIYTLLNTENDCYDLNVDAENLPKRLFTKGKRKLVGFRLPTELSEQLTKLAKELGWTVTDVAQTALDQYVRKTREQEKARKK